MNKPIFSKAVYLLLALFSVFPLVLIVLTTMPTHAATRVPSSTTITNVLQTGTTTAWANVRSAPNVSSSIIATYAPATTITIYTTESGQAVWNNDANWYRISQAGSSAQYIYSELVSLSSSEKSTGNTFHSTNKVIEVSLSRSWLYAYENGKQVFDAAVITGRPTLPTPTGTFHVFAKLSPTTFYSPWPVGSSNYYPPTHINYALEFLRGGYFLHDTWWHSVYGLGTNGWHYDPVDGWQFGSHGCVGMPLSAAKWLYNWTPIGTTVQIAQ